MIKYAVIGISGVLLGAIVMALVLDNRFGAMVKAFQHPQAVNSAVFNDVISQK